MAIADLPHYFIFVISFSQIIKKIFTKKITKKILKKTFRTDSYNEPDPKVTGDSRMASITWKEATYREEVKDSKKEYRQRLTLAEVLRQA